MFKSALLFCTISMPSPVVGTLLEAMQKYSPSSDNSRLATVRVEFSWLDPTLPSSEVTVIRESSSMNMRGEPSDVFLLAHCTSGRGNPITAQVKDTSRASFLAVVGGSIASTEAGSVGKEGNE